MDAAGFFPGYYEGITDSQSKKRYKEKLEVVKLDPYEVKRADWEDDVELWPAVTHVHVCMYLILTPSPYTFCLQKLDDVDTCTCTTMALKKPILIIIK